MNRKIVGVIIAVLIIIVVIVGFSKSKSPAKLTVGAILPMTGPTAIYGEQLKFGMEYALNELDKDHTVDLKIEDSAGDAKTGISAFNKLLTTNNPDLFVSAFSRVSVPLKDLAKKNNKPLVMTLVSAMSAVNKDNPSLVRVFYNAETIADSHIKTLKVKGFKHLGVIYTNDEFGASVNEVLKNKLTSSGITVSSEAFSPQDNDYRTQIQKMKSSGVDVVLFVTIPPTSLQNFVKQTKELSLNVPIIDGGGVSPGAGALKLIGLSAEGMYTFATSFDLGLTGTDLRKALDDKGLEKTYAAAFGYDVMKYIIETKKNPSPIKSFEGLQGVYNVALPEIQPVIVPVQIVNGKFVEVK